jgi:regulator of protease activity HflC (stomatin/prohibitin superfamily)
MLPPIATVLLLVVGLILSGVKILKEYERAVVFRLGRLVSARGPGIIYVIPMIERMQRIELRTITMDVPAQDVITKDNVSVKVSAVLYFRVIDPSKAIVEVVDYLFATSQLAQTTLRSVCGQAELDELLAERDKINEHIQEILDQQTDPWGIKVVSVEVKHIDLPQEMQRAMARQAEAERERRAKVINAEGEFQAAQKLADASAVIGQHPMALQLRFLQTLTEVASENNSTTVFPLPIDLLRPFIEVQPKPEPKPEPNPEAKVEPKSEET